MLQRQSLDVSVAETVAGCECCRQSLDVSVAKTVSMLIAGEEADGRGQ